MAQSGFRRFPIGPTRRIKVALAATACLALAAGAGAQIAQPPRDSLGQLAFASDVLKPARSAGRLDEVRSALPLDVAAAWDGFRAQVGTGWVAYADRRSGRVEYAEGGKLAWIPGAGNALSAGLDGAKGEMTLSRLEGIARGFVASWGGLLGVAPADLVLSSGRSGRVASHLWLVDFDVLRGGRPIEGARVFFRVNNGNLIQWGSENLPPPNAKAPADRIGRDKALAALSAYVGGFSATDSWIDPGSLHLLPAAVGDPKSKHAFAPGAGLRLLSAWQFTFRREGSHGTWRGRVDAETGVLLDFTDQNDYVAAQVRGGVALDNTSGEMLFAMPYADLSAAPFATDAGGTYLNLGATSSTLDGTYVSIADDCGSISQASTFIGLIDFSSGFGTDCATPFTGGAGNTRSARTQTFHINRGKDMARGWLPGVTWLDDQVTVNTNNSPLCNASWSPGAGTLNFYQADSPCANTGEIPAVALHEFGHGLDSNDGTSRVDEGTGEAYGDTLAFLTTHNSCIGSGFLTDGSFCGGYGDECTACTGVRDVDWGKHDAATPHTVDNFIRTDCPADSSYEGPCGEEGHCESYVATEAIWDFANRDHSSPGSTAAWNLLERLWFGSRPTASSAFTCDTSGATWLSDGCASGTLWRTMRAVDDDDGDLTNGTPHSAELFAALDRHGIACSSDAGATTSYAACTPPAVPTVTITASSYSMSLSWTDSGVGMVYDVFRNETGCDTGFQRIADDVATTSYVDNETNPISPYTYLVVAHPAGNEACSSAPSSCQSKTAADDADLWGRDKPWDTGLEPDPATASNNMWESEAITVRNDATIGAHQDPIAGQLNYVHVFLENKGPNTIYNAVVRVYYAVASSGLAWPEDWTEIGAGAVGSLASGFGIDVSVPWVPTVSGHVCLLARVESVQDPMTFAEGTDVNYNTRYNNNIVWRNVNVVDLFGAELVAGRMIVRNVADTLVLTRLTFRDRLDAGVRLPFLQRGRILIDLGPDLYSRWVANGSVGQNVHVAGPNTIEVHLAGTAPYIQFQTAANEEFEIHPSFQSTAANVDRTKTDKHVFEIRQSRQLANGNTLVGGVTYQIKAPFKK